MRSVGLKEGKSFKSIYQWGLISKNVKNLVNIIATETTKRQEKINKKEGTSLVVQWIRISLPVQGTWVQSLLQEDSTG